MDEARPRDLRGGLLHFLSLHVTSAPLTSLFDQHLQIVSHFHYSEQYNHLCSSGYTGFRRSALFSKGAPDIKTLKSLRLISKCFNEAAAQVLFRTRDFVWYLADHRKPMLMALIEKSI